MSLLKSAISLLLIQLFILNDLQEYAILVSLLLFYGWQVSYHLCLFSHHLGSLHLSSLSMFCIGLIVFALEHVQLRDRVDTLTLFVNIIEEALGEALLTFEAML